MNNTSKKRVLKREPIANLSGDQLGQIKGGTTVLCGVPSIASCDCGRPTSNVTCHNTGYYCCQP